MVKFLQQLSTFRIFINCALRKKSKKRLILMYRGSTKQFIGQEYLAR